MSRRGSFILKDLVTVTHENSTNQTDVLVADQLQPIEDLAKVCQEQVGKSLPGASWQEFARSKLARVCQEQVGKSLPGASW